LLSKKNWQIGKEKSNTHLNGLGKSHIVSLRRNFDFVRRNDGKIDFPLEWVRKSNFAA